jgi:hypoxanthine phosphoribosyltransferase
MHANNYNYMTENYWVVYSRKSKENNRNMVKSTPTERMEEQVKVLNEWVKTRKKNA